MKVITAIFLVGTQLFSLPAANAQSCLPTDGLVPITAASSSQFLNDTASFNQRLQPVPAAIVYPSTPAEVSAAVLCAKQSGLNVSVRSGGHSYASYSLGGTDGSLVIDLSAFNAIVVNADGTAEVGAGQRLGDVALALNEGGRAIPHGTCPYVGIGGHASFGGFGLPSRMWGLTLDNIVGLSVVLANGTILPSVTSSSDPDLFWALRGSAASFGVITSFVFKTFAVPTKTTNFIWSYAAGVLNASAAASVFSAYQSFGASSIPAELSLAVVAGPGGTFAISGAFYGSAADFNATVKSFVASLPSGYATTIEELSWINSVIYTADGQDLNTTLASDIRDTFYAKSILSPSATLITDAVLKSFFSYLYTTNTTTEWFMEVNLVGGTNSVINTVSLDTTSYAHRDTLLLFQLYASSADYAPPYPSAGITFVQGMYDAIVTPMKPAWGSSYGSYVNYVDPLLSAEEVKTLYWGAHYPRLASIKAQYDPTGVFTNPQSIIGAAGAANGTSTTGTASGTAAPSGTGATKSAGSGRSVHMRDCWLGAGLAVAGLELLS